MEEEAFPDHLGSLRPLSAVASLAAHAASGCIISPPGPPPAAFEAPTLDSEGTKSPQRIHIPGLSFWHLPRKPDCLLHLLFDEPAAPVIDNIQY